MGFKPDTIFACFEQHFTFRDYFIDSFFPAFNFRHQTLQLKNLNDALRYEEHSYYLNKE